MTTSQYNLFTKQNFDSQVFHIEDENWHQWNHNKMKNELSPLTFQLSRKDLHFDLLFDNLAS